MIYTRTLFFSALIAVFAMCWGAAVSAEPVPVESPPGYALGQHADYLIETNGKLGLNEAISAYREGRFTHGKSPALNFGIGSQPAWIRLEASNPSASSLVRRLSVEISWLDKVDVSIRAGDGTVASYPMGDAQPYARRPVDSRFFALDHDFAPGISEIFIRVETTDPMLVPVYLREVEDALTHERMENYSYGIVYGFLLALIGYNSMLYVGLRSRRYILYSAYLAFFLLMNMAYTGHGYSWFWPEQPALQLWIIPSLISLYSLSGLLFASSFLDTKRNFPRIHRALIGFCTFFILLLTILFIGDFHVPHMVAAFVLGFLFSFLMILLGILSLMAGHKPARYFLLGAVSGMLGASTIDLAVSGIIPYNIFTYHGFEIGMLVDGTLLALALAYQFREGQEKKFIAERMAMADPLTGLNNRRAFHDFARPIWSNALRNQRNVSLILLDIDHFKQINDTYGHAAGDEVLIAVASTLKGVARDADIVARWGGEEFILLLPETNLEEARTLAERLRLTLSEIRIDSAKGAISFTASFGVTQRDASCTSIEELTSEADNRLYQAKHEGRNRICAPDSVNIAPRQSEAK